jgi:aminopeptidase N
LSTAERLSLLNDEAALVMSGQDNVSGYLNLLSALNQDDENVIVESYVNTLASIHDHLLTDTTKPVFTAWVRNTFSPMFTKVGWEPAANETDDRHELRAQLVRLLGEVGEDPEVIRHSVELARKYATDTGALDPSLVRAVLSVAAMSNSPELFGEYVTAISSPKSSPEQLSDYGRALARFTDPKLVEKWLQKIVAPETRNQDTSRYLARVLENPAIQPIAWQWTKQHWSEVQGKLTTASGYAIVSATGRFCDAGMRSDVQQFFVDNKVASTERTLKQSLELMDSCVHFRARQEPNLAGWLQQHTSSASGGTR